jgi:DNA-3-methyladenine glycosylase II
MPFMKVTAGLSTRASTRCAIRHLSGRDPLLAEVIRRAGPCRIEGRREPFLSLAEAIVYQQLSMKAAAAIWRRFAALFPGRRVTAAALAAIPEERLRGAGLSRRKCAYLRDLASRFASGEIEPRALRRMKDDEVVETLTRIKGVGRWTAEMFLIFCLKRPDVWPVDDLGVLKGLQRLYGMRRLPRRARAERLGERWRPYRTVATWYLWRGLDNGGIG